MHLRLILAGTASLVISFVASLTAMSWLWPQGNISAPKPAVAALPPLPPSTRNSSIVVPIAISLAAIRDAAERAAPHTFNGKSDNTPSKLLANADVSWDIARGPIAASGSANALSMSTSLNGTVHALGSLSQQAGGSATGSVSSLLGDAGKKFGNIGINIKNVDASAAIKGNIVIASRPTLLPNWRLEPNLAAQVNLADTSLSASGLRVPLQLKPVIDRMVNEQVVAMQQRVRANPIIEQNAKAEWTKMCHSFPVQASAGMPELWVELRPVKLSAMQPRIDANNLMLTLALEGETRITATETKPICPFPGVLEIVPSLDAGRVDIAVPIDLPFSEVNTIIDAQLKGRTFPDDGSGAVAITVKKASVEPAGDRLLISLVVNAEEKKSFFGFGGDATIHVYGKPVLDAANQVLHLTDIKLAVESQAVFGLLGAAARAALPHLQRALAEKAQIDLKPFAADARDKIAAAMNQFRTAENGVTVVAAVTGLRLADIAFDANALRVNAEADGTVNVQVTQLPAM